MLGAVEPLAPAHPLQPSRELGIHGTARCVQPSHRHTLISFSPLIPRCIPCIGAQEPASKGPRRSFPKASSPTGASRTQRPGRPPRPHRALSGETNPSQETQPFLGNPALPGLPPSRFLCPHLPNLRLFLFLKMHFLGVPCKLCDADTPGEKRGFFLASAELRFG